MFTPLSIKSLVAGILMAAASRLTYTGGGTKRARSLPFGQLGGTVPVHTNPQRNAERKELRAMGRRQFIKAKKYRNAAAR